MSPVQLPPMPVTVAQPLEREVIDAVYFTGRTDGSEFVEVRARVSGYLTKVNFSAGKLIKEGAPLFEIDDRPYVVSLDQANGELERVATRSKRTKLDLERGEALNAKKAITREEYDKYVADNAEALAAVRSAEAAVDRAKLDLVWTKISSPINGIVSRELITVGNLVKADQTLLTTILRPDPMYVYFDIDERTVLRILQLIREGKFKSARENAVPIRMGLGNDDNYPYDGIINFVDNRLDPNSGTMRIRGSFENPPMENGSIKLAAGFFARVKLELGTAQKRILITERAILSDQDQKFVYVVSEQGDVERRDVTLGSMEEGLRVVEAGLTTKDRIIISGVQRVRPGATVKPKEVAMPERVKLPTPATAASTPVSQPAVSKPEPALPETPAADEKKE